jgi:hypothetical protein
MIQSSSHSIFLAVHLVLHFNLEAALKTKDSAEVAQLPVVACKEVHSGLSRTDSALRPDAGGVGSLKPDLGGDSELSCL